eukprot:scaffold984_cov144-Skeletonema_marinoi.AAC.4
MAIKPKKLSLSKILKKKKKQSFPTTGQQKRDSDTSRSTAEAAVNANDNDATPSQLKLNAAVATAEEPQVVSTPVTREDNTPLKPIIRATSNGDESSTPPRPGSTRRSVHFSPAVTTKAAKQPPEKIECNAISPSAPPNTTLTEMANSTNSNNSHEASTPTGEAPLIQSPSSNY